jgi:hypothetical protein
MAGIVRIKIKSDWHDWRTQMSEDLAPAASLIYRNIFTLADGDETIECTKEEAQSRYDWKEGIDVLLHFTDGTKATLQEKFLDWCEDTATFEEQKTSGAPGAWYYCTAQYYFVGYTRRYKKERLLQFQTFMMLDLPALHREDHKNELPWEFNQNHYDGRHSTFRFLRFSYVPASCIIDSYTLKMEWAKCHPANFPRPTF